MTALQLSLSLMLAAIMFGTPGPLLHARYADSAISADIAYRIAPDKFYNTGPAALSPSIATGTLVYRANGRSHSYDLASILPIHEHRIIFPNSPRDGCGATQALTRRGNYLAIEIIYAEKGCRPDVAFIEISSGTVVEHAELDWTWDHRFDLTQPIFHATKGRVDSIETLHLREVSTDSAAAPVIVYLPWTFRVVHWSDRNGTQRVLAYEVHRTELNGRADPGYDVTPKAGATLFVGHFQTPIFPAYDSTIVRLDAAANARYAALQTPTPPDLERSLIRDEWLTLAGQRASDGDLAGAIRAFAKVVDYDDDPEMRAGDAAMLEACRSQLPIVGRKKLGPLAIGTLFSNGCKPGP
jgi:hypothetical protein